MSIDIFRVLLGTIEEKGFYPKLNGYIHKFQKSLDNIKLIVYYIIDVYYYRIDRLKGGLTKGIYSSEIKKGFPADLVRIAKRKIFFCFNENNFG